MPDPQPPKRLPPLHAARPRSQAPAIRYAELHCRTNFSFLEGASHPDELAARAAELGYAALAITDRNSVAGAVRAHVAAKEAGVKLLVGAEVTPVDAPPALLWATDRAAYGRLAKLLTLGRRAAPKGECHLTFDDVAAHAAGLLAGVLLTSNRDHRLSALGGMLSRPDSESSNPNSALGRESMAPCTHQATVADCRSYRAVFADRCYAVAELHRSPEDGKRLQQ